MSRIPTTIITGFLGSGKTTLLNRGLRDPGLRHAAVIVNEFGEIGLDHDLIEASDDAVVLLENGCLCCSVRGDLISTLMDLHRKRARQQIPAFDHVLIETSGLADPTAVAEVFRSEPSVRGCYTLAGIVASVDAVNGLETLEAHDQWVMQVALADRIIITKSDLQARTDELLAQVRRINPNAAVLDACSVRDAGALFLFHSTGGDEDCWTKPTSTDRSGLDAGSQHGLAHGERVNRFTVLRDEPWDMQTLDLFIQALVQNAGPSLLRVKGIIGIDESPQRPVVVHGAQHLIHKTSWLDEWPSDDRRTRIVFITLDWREEDVQRLVSDVERVSRRTRSARLGSASL